MQIKSRVFYVTGGASGLGLGTVHELVKRGAYVSVLDLNEELGERIEMELKEVVIFNKCDVTKEEDIIKAIAETDKKWGDRLVGGVVHCGGVGMAGKTIGNDLEPFPLDVYRQVIEINLVGSFNVARLVAQRIIKSHPPPPSHKDKGQPEVTEDRGVIIFTSSVSYEEGQMGQTAYASSKAGVVGLTLPMARDLARFGIRVVSIAPSLFDTAMGANTSPKVKESLLSTTLFPRRFGQASEFAHLAASIIENGMLNGSVIRLDGGSRMSKM
ncbi:NAD(P)-binding protein [Meredithblackwellia eburnea MCA 4105]